MVERPKQKDADVIFDSEGDEDNDDRHRPSQHHGNHVLSPDQILVLLEVYAMMWIPKDFVSAGNPNISKRNAPLQIMFILMSRKRV